MTEWLSLSHSHSFEHNTVTQYEWVSEVAQSCPTLCDPMDCSLQGSSVHEIFQARVLEWVAIYVSITFIWTGEPNKFLWLPVLWYLLHCSRWEPNPQYLQGLPVLPMISSFFFCFYFLFWIIVGFPKWYNVKESAWKCRRHKKCGLDSWVRRIPWSRTWQLTLEFLPKKFHGQRSLVGACKESGTTQQLNNSNNSWLTMLC